MARSTKHYLIELEDKNETTINENKNNHKNEENFDIHVEKKNHERMNVKPRKVF